MNIKRLVISIAFVLALLVPGATAFAATCFCNIEGTGAEATGGASDAAACQTVCAGKAKSVGYLWATQVDQGPSSLLQCFSKKELCETDMNDDKVVDGTFDSKQPAECLPGWHYCYPNDTIKYNLQISIPNASGETTSVYNYGEYVGVMYKYLLGIAVTIAIVFVMIGGIRYVIGASTGEIGKAKDMIVKAISGLVLLLFAYVILFTVNPELIKLQVPKLPMIRQVVLLTGGEDCTSLDKKGYEIDWTHATKGKYKAKSCGSVAAVLKDAAGADVAEGTTCVYTECDQVDASCGTYTVGGASAAATCVPSGNAYWCVRCGQVNPDSDCGIPPSSALCSAMDRPDTYVNLVEASPAYDEYNVCGYTHEPSMFSSGGGAAAAMTATVAAGILSGGTAAGVIGAWYTADVALDAKTGSCVDMSIDCKKVTTCVGYNDPWQVANGITDNELYDLDWPILGNPNIVNVCNSDPCGVRTAIGKSGETCAYNEGTGNCQSADYAPPEVDYSGSRPSGARGDGL